MIIPFHEARVFDPWRALTPQQYAAANTVLERTARAGRDYTLVILRSIADHGATVTSELVSAWYHNVGTTPSGAVILMGLKDRVARLEHAIGAEKAEVAAMKNALRLFRDGQCKATLSKTGANIMRLVRSVAVGRGGFLRRNRVFIVIFVLIAVGYFIARFRLGRRWWGRRERRWAYRAAVDRANTILERAGDDDVTCGICLGSLRETSFLESVAPSLRASPSPAPTRATPNPVVAGATPSLSVEVVAYRCGHAYHGVCSRRWLDKSNRCPMCRARDPMNPETPPPSPGPAPDAGAGGGTLQLWSRVHVDRSLEVLAELLDVPRAHYTDSHYWVVTGGPEVRSNTPTRNTMWSDFLLASLGAGPRGFDDEGYMFMHHASHHADTDGVEERW
eukprot:PhM_4_TR12776/c0_g1_i1/m.31423